MIKLLENEQIREKFIFTLEDHSHDWKWLIDYIEKEYRFENCNDWFEFNKRIPEPIVLFDKIVKLDRNAFVQFHSDLIKQMYYISLVKNKVVSFTDVKDKINEDILKLILLNLYVTQMLNKDNNTKFDYFWEIFTDRNLFQIYNLASVIDRQEEILTFLKTINLNNIENIKNVLLANINKKKVNYHNSLIDDATFQIKNMPPFYDLPWQEHVIINSLCINSYDKKDILPFIWVPTSYDYPKIKNWNIELINKLKTYFGENNKFTNFIIETIYYLKERKQGNTQNNKKLIPSSTTLHLHLKLLNDAIKAKTSARKIIRSTSMRLISYLFKDRIIKTIKSDDYFENFLRWINIQTDISIEQAIASMQLPISADNQLWIFKSEKRRLTNLNTVNNIREFCMYLNQKELVKVVTQDHLQNIKNRFWYFVSNSSVSSLFATLFIDYAVFLNNCFNNKKLNREFLILEIIQVQHIWETKIYKSVINTMSEKEIEVNFSEKETKAFRELYKSDPIAFSHQIIPLDEKNIIKCMEKFDKAPLLSEFSHIEVDPLFPRIKNAVNINHHKVEKIALDYLDKLNEKYNGLFINNLTSSKILIRLLNFYLQNMPYIYFLDEQDMYKTVCKNQNYTLSTYPSNINVGLVSQLFPVLEGKIRLLASKLGISPFKNNSFGDADIKYNDPSTLLIKVITIIYEDKKDLLSAQGFIFVYLVMYDSNFTNIRNDFIHGRKYINKNDLDFAFRSTLLSISIIDEYFHRINNA